MLLPLPDMFPLCSPKTRLRRVSLVLGSHGGTRMGTAIRRSLASVADGAAGRAWVALVEGA